MSAVVTPPSAFTPTTALSDNPRLWKGDIGLMNSSKTHVVFTIDSLVGYLKTLQVEVDSNLNEFKTLPKYAALGAMEPLGAVAASTAAAATTADSTASNAAPAIAHNDAAPIPNANNMTTNNQSVLNAVANTTQTQAPAAAAPRSAPAANVFIPTRKVREPPGGGTLTIGNLFGGDEEQPPARRQFSSSGASSILPENASNPKTGFIPTRKVREPPGGISQIGAILSGQ